MATIHYGAHHFTIENETVATSIGQLIRNIMQAGDTQWLPLTSDEGAAVDILITAGVPIVISYEAGAPAEDHLQDLVDSYLGDGSDGTVE